MDVFLYIKKHHVIQFFCLFLKSPKAFSVFLNLKMSCSFEILKFLKIGVVCSRKSEKPHTLYLDNENLHNNFLTFIAQNCRTI